MCWNASVSLNTYIFGLFACLFAYFNNKISLLNVFSLQSFMMLQLTEYFIWSKQFSNRLLSQLSYILILSQPFFGLLTIDKPIKNVLLFLYICFIAVLMILKPWSSIDFRTIPAANGHLAWHWLQFSFPLISIWFLFLILNQVLKRNWILLLCVSIAISVSYILYHETLTWGSLWCWISNVFAVYLIYTVFEDDTGTVGSLRRGYGRNLRFHPKGYKKNTIIIIMFLEVLLHLSAYKMVNNKWCIEFYNVQRTDVLTLSGASFPLLRVGSVFLPFIFIDFQWTPLMISLFLLSLT